MSEFYNLCTKVSSHLEESFSQDPLGLIRAKGEVATRTGFLVSLVGPGDPDDPAKIRLLQDVAKSLDIPV